MKRVEENSFIRQLQKTNVVRTGGLSVTNCNAMQLVVVWTKTQKQVKETQLCVLFCFVFCICVHIYPVKGLHSTDAAA